MTALTKSYLCVGILVACFSLVLGLTVEDIVPFGADIDRTVPIGTGNYAEVFQMRTMLVYNRRRHKDVYINTNGFLTLGKPLEEEFLTRNFSLSDADIVAPFLTRADTGNGGEVFYREATETRHLEQAALDINRYFRPARQFVPTSLLVVTWYQIAPRSGNKQVNTFQMVMATQEYDSYITFSYVSDELQWVEGQPGDFPAQAGMDTARGNNIFVLPYSGTGEANKMASESNIGVRGRWMFHVGNMRTFSGPPSSISPVNPQPEKNPNESGGGEEDKMDGDESQSCGHRDLTGCHEHAECRVQSTGGSCCYCTGLYFGNGKTCFEKESQLRAYGELSGSLGFEEITAIPFYTSMHASSGRALVAAGPLPVSVAEPLQILLNVGEVIGFMIAMEPGNTKNGLSLMGSRVNYTGSVTFDTGETVVVEIRFQGVDQSGFLQVSVDIRGSLPRVTGSAFEQEPSQSEMSLTKVAPGRLVGRSSKRVTIGGVEYRATVDNSFEYEECQYYTITTPTGSEIQIEFTEYLHFYDSRSTRGSVLRYMLTASMVDPYADTCKGIICPDSSKCVPDAISGYVCQCEEGYEMSRGQCTDIDECIQDICREHSTCTNAPGTFTCDCQDGYVRTSRLSCLAVDPEPRGSCEDIVCGDHAYCELDSESFPSCLCETGYVLQKVLNRCTAVDPEESSCYYSPGICSQFAQCKEVDEQKNFQCVCNAGYLGDGISCVKAYCRGHHECDPSARCLYSTQIGGDSAYRCHCNPGLVGDGQTCTEEGKPEPGPETCNDIGTCHPNAVCEESVTGPSCRCLEGYDGDGEQCIMIDSCFHRPDMCDAQAVCNRGPSGVHRCVCKPGLSGSGTRCYPAEPSGSYLLVSGGVSVFQVPYDRDSSVPSKRILYRQKDTIIGLEVDCKDRYMFWTDVSLHRIMRASLGQPDDAEVLVSENLVSPEGLAVDWMNRNLFWTDSGVDKIEVAKLDGTSRKTIVSRGLVNPRAIVADPYSGKIYWTDWNRRGAKIESANMDGSSRSVIVRRNLVLPNGLAMDFSQRKLCWADAGNGRVECVNPDGSGREMIYSKANYPFSLAVLGDTLYWTDWKIDSVQSIRRYSTELEDPIPFPPGDRQRAFGIIPVSQQCPKVSGRQNPCAYLNGGCRFLCLPVSASERICACPDDVTDETCNEVNKFL